MKTCNVCGMGYQSKNEDVLIYGCIKCKRGFEKNWITTDPLKKRESPHSDLKVWGSCKIYIQNA